MVSPWHHLWVAQPGLYQQILPGGHLLSREETVHFSPKFHNNVMISCALAPLTSRCLYHGPYPLLCSSSTAQSIGKAVSKAEGRGCRTLCCGVFQILQDLLQFADGSWGRARCRKGFSTDSPSCPGQKEGSRRLWRMQRLEEEDRLLA